MWFRKNKLDPAEASRRLRDAALAMTAAEIGLAPAPGSGRVWGVLMETGYPEAVATLACFADGTTSMYISSGRGVIGAGEKTAVRHAATAFLALAERHVSQLSTAESWPLPPTGATRFYLHTHDGLLTAEAFEDDLGNNRHPLSPLFHGGHAVIGAIRAARLQM